MKYYDAEPNRDFIHKISQSRILVAPARKIGKMNTQLYARRTKKLKRLNPPDALIIDNVLSRFVEWISVDELIDLVVRVQSNFDRGQNLYTRRSTYLSM